MKIEITQKLCFSKKCILKICHSWFSVKDPDFIEEASQRIEYTNHQINLPDEMKKIFNPNQLKVISILSIDKNKKRKLESHVVRS